MEGKEMTTKTVEEEAKIWFDKLQSETPIDQEYWEKDFINCYVAAHRSCEQKLAAGDGAYNLGYERGSSRWRPIKIDPKDASTWPPKYGDFFINVDPRLAGWQVQNLSEADDAYYKYWCESASCYSWLMPPKIEGER